MLIFGQFVEEIRLEILGSCKESVLMKVSDIIKYIMKIM